MLTSAVALALTLSSAGAQDFSAAAARESQLIDAGRLSLSLGNYEEKVAQTPRKVKRKGKAKPAEAPVIEAQPSERSMNGRFDLVVSNAPASKVFLQLGAGSDYNILVPPDLDGKISISLRDTTVLEALEALRELYGYDFRIAGNRIFVASNALQTRIYKVNYLPGRRQGLSLLNVSSASVNGQSGTSGSAPSTASGSSGSGSASGSGAGAAPSGATSIVQTSSDADFWREVKESLGAMLGDADGRNVTINIGAGVIVVRATPNELRQVADYLRAVQLTIERQVMLEAKIVEVVLSKEFETGVNWTAFRTFSSGKTITGAGASKGTTLSSTGNGVQIVTQDAIKALSLGSGFYGLAVQAANFSALLQFLETQGDVQVLSSPRIAALNGQKSVLKVGTDESFVVKVTSNITVINNNPINNPSFESRPFFSGISLDVTPQIDEGGMVMLHVHPAISKATKGIESLIIGGVQYDVPNVSVEINETDSMVRVKDGQIVAIGGLMQQRGEVTSTGVPVLKDTPVLGNLFGYKTKTTSKRELVILIKPTVIADDGSGASTAQPATPLLPPQPH